MPGYLVYACHEACQWRPWSCFLNNSFSSSNDQGYNGGDGVRTVKALTMVEHLIQLMTNSLPLTMKDNQHKGDKASKSRHADPVADPSRPELYMLSGFGRIILSSVFCTKEWLTIATKPDAAPQGDKAKRCTSTTLTHIAVYHATLISPLDQDMIPLLVINEDDAADISRYFWNVSVQRSLCGNDAGQQEGRGAVIALRAAWHIEGLSLLGILPEGGSRSPLDGPPFTLTAVRAVGGGSRTTDDLNVSLRPSLVVDVASLDAPQLLQSLRHKRQQRGSVTVTLKNASLLSHYHDSLHLRRVIEAIHQSQVLGDGVIDTDGEGHVHIPSTNLVVPTNTGDILPPAVAGPLRRALFEQLIVQRGRPTSKGKEPDRPGHAADPQTLTAKQLREAVSASVPDNVIGQRPRRIVEAVVTRTLLCAAKGEELAMAGIMPPKGVLLYDQAPSAACGSTATGKTFLMGAMARTVAEVRFKLPQLAGVRCAMVDAHALVSKEVGSTEKNIAAMMRAARRKPRKNTSQGARSKDLQLGNESLDSMRLDYSVNDYDEEYNELIDDGEQDAYTATLLLIDHLEVIAPPRRLSSDDGGDSVGDRALSTLLAELDGVGTSTYSQDGACRHVVILIATASSLSALDPAVYRPGRLDLHIAMPPPTPLVSLRVLLSTLEPITSCCLEILEPLIEGSDSDTEETSRPNSAIEGGLRPGGTTALGSFLDERDPTLQDSPLSSAEKKVLLLYNIRTSDNIFFRCSEDARGALRWPVSVADARLIGRHAIYGLFSRQDTGDKHTEAFNCIKDWAKNAYSPEALLLKIREQVRLSFTTARAI